MVATLKIEKLTEREQFVNALVYGESGVGKTTWAASAPRPILWLESEGGTASIADREGIDIARVTGLETYREALQLLQSDPDAYKTVVLDSFTETQAGILKEIMRAAVAADDTGSRDEFSPLFSEWGRLTGVMREIARGFRDLPMHTIITALQREDTDALSGRVKVRPRLSPALADELPGYMDVVGYLYAKGDIIDTKALKAGEEQAPIERVMLLRPTVKHVAKLRAPKGSNPPDVLVNSEFEDVAALLGVKL